MMETLVIGTGSVGCAATMKKCFVIVLLLILALCTAAYSEECVDTLTYAVFPYVPDVEYYCELIESRWAELETNINLVRAEWDCYHDGEPEGIDVIMFDAVTRDTLLSAGWIQPIRPGSLQESEDFFPFALEGFTVGDDLYGIPVFLCGNFLIYDQGCEAVATAEHITDLTDASGILVVNSEDPVNRPQYVSEVIADETGEANPSADDGAEDMMRLIDRLAIDAHKHDNDTQVATAYDSGVGQGYIGFSESMRFLKRRSDVTRIKSISFSEQENTLRVYADAVAVTTGAKGQRYEKSLKLMNVMAEADILTALSVRDGVPQYLLLARRSPYQPLADQFEIYNQLECLASNEENHVIVPAVRDVGFGNSSADLLN